jgi:hypothetical protein
MLIHMNNPRIHRTGALTALLLCSLLIPTLAADTVVDAVDSVAATPGTGELSVSVGSVAIDGVAARISPVIAAALQDSLLGAAQRGTGRRSVVVRTEAPSDLVVRVEGSAGSDSALFVVQYVDAMGVLRGSNRVTVTLDETLSDAMQPAAISGAGSAVAGGDDAPDTRDAARVVGLDSTTAGLSLTEGDEDWFRFSVDEIPPIDGMPAVRVFTEGTTDTYIEVFGPNDPYAPFTENDDYEDRNANVEFVVAEGEEYWVLVRGFANSATGSYDLRVNTYIMQPDQWEPNDQVDDASPLTLQDLPLGASIRPGGDHDWYQLDVDALLAQLGSPAEGRTLVIETESSLDTYITVYTPDGTVLTSDDDGGLNGNASVHIPAGSGEVFVEVRGYGDWVEGDYDLLVREDIVELDEWEPDNLLTEARPIQLDSGRRRYTFSSNSDADWVRFELTSPATVVMETYGGVDTYLRLYNADGDEITQDDDSGSGFNARIEEALGAGIWYLEMTPLYLYNDETSYEVEIRTVGR